MIDEATPKHIPINGRYKLQASNGYESFLAFQGAPWPIRKAIMLDTGAIAIIETTDHMVKFCQLGIIRQRFELEFDVEPVEHVMRIARVSQNGRLFKFKVITFFNSFTLMYMQKYYCSANFLIPQKKSRMGFES